MKIRKIFADAAVYIIAVLLSACSTTTFTETEYADDGITVKAQKTTQTSGNPLAVLAKNSASKSWAVHQGGWFFNLGYCDWGVSGGTLDNTIASVCDSPNGVSAARELAGIVSASKYSIAVTKDGIASEAAASNTAADSSGK